MAEKDKMSLIDKALDMISSDMDGMEGHSAMSHSIEDCPDPMNCSMHDSELGDNVAPEQEPGSPGAVEVTVHKMGMPSMEGKSASDEEDDHLTPEDVEVLKKILK